MEVVDFTPNDQQGTSKFLRSIANEMGWKDIPDYEYDNIWEYFKLPNDGFFLLAKNNNTIIGAAGIKKLNNTQAVVKRFFVHKNYRGQGVAQSLLKHLISKAKEMAVERIVLDVLKSNARAIRFYEKSGFKRYNQKPIKGWEETLGPDIFYYYHLELK